ncbi:MAG: chemotaxis protein CheA [Desulfobacterales bacterium]|nr:chemotaxis protein CheA [Desulfobacterales bacterium]
MSLIEIDDRERIKDFVENFKESFVGQKDRILTMENYDGPHHEFKDIVSQVLLPLLLINASSKVFNIDLLTNITDLLINLLDLIKVKKIKNDSDIIDCLLSSTDKLEKIVSIIENAVDRNFNSIEIDMEKEGISEVINWIEDILSNLQEKKEADAKLTQDKPLSFDLGFSTQMTQDFFDEGHEFIKSVEDSLLVIESNSSKDNAVDLANESDKVLRGLHSLKGNAGLLLSLVKDQNERETHILNKIRVLSHSAETLVQIKRDLKEKFDTKSISLLFSVCDISLKLVDAFYNGDHKGIDVSELIQNCEKFSGAVQEKTQEKKIKGDSPKESAFLNILYQVIESLEGGLTDIKSQDESKKKKGFSKIKRAFSTLKKLGETSGKKEFAQIGQTGLTAFEDLKISTNEIAIQKNYDFFYEVLALIKNTVEKKPEIKNQSEMNQQDAEYEKRSSISKVSESSKATMLKVPKERADHLMNLIGELVINKNGLLNLSRLISVEYNRPDIGSKVKEIGSVIGRISDDLQSSIMEIRMTPVNQVFLKFPRLVRDICHETGKNIRIDIVGGDTEIDKTIIEVIGTPLLHLVRNSADHGIEFPDVRKKAGKPEQGVISLMASNEGQNVLIQIVDDGGGIDPEIIGKLAVEKNIISQEALAKMQEKDIQNIIFYPGFSSAKKVTDISGRGVGMDVVKKEIEAIGGNVWVESTKGIGTKVSILLPLTLALSQGLKVSVSNEQYYIPLSYVRETVKIPYSNFRFYRDIAVVNIKNNILPVYSLKKILGLDSGKYDKREKDLIASLVILDIMGKKIAIDVDKFDREETYVMKNISGSLGKLQVLMGASITSKGNIILVLNPLKF